MTVQTRAGATGDFEFEALDKKYVTANSSGIKVDIKDDVAIERLGAIEITYGADNTKLAMAQRTAGTEEIKGYYDAGTAVPERVSSARDITVTNVADGSGEATIDNIEVDAGSTDNDFTIRFTAQGSMDGGQVLLVSPTDWGSFQGTDPAGDNYIDIVASRGGTLEDTGVGNDRAIAHLESFGYNNNLVFTIRNLEAQAHLGIASFVISSAGDDSGTLVPVLGEELPDDVDTEAEKVLQKKVLETGVADPNPDDTVYLDRDGKLRVQVGGGGDGSGKVTVDIVGTREGPGLYDVPKEDEPGTDELTVERVHAGDDGSTYLLFTYTPIETIALGELEFTTPANWSPPQVDSTREPGYVRLVPSGGAVGSPEINGGRLTVEIHSLDRDGSIAIHYGEGDGGAVPPTTAQAADAFTFKIKGSSDSDSSLQTIPDQPTVRVRPQASGRGGCRHRNRWRRARR